MKAKLKGILTLLLALVVQISFAQEKTISGTVSEASGVLPGVSVSIKGTTEGTETDFDGKYSIKANTGAILIFRYLGYAAVEKTVGASSTINVILTVSEDNVLDEIILTSLGLERKKDNDLSSSTVVKVETLAKSGESGLIQGLAGKTSGLKITRNSGDPGSGAYIQIRGQNTILGSSSPLIIVDGVPISNTSVGGGVDGVAQQSRLNDINTEDIANVTILKGAAAAAVWGTGAANGVIVIQTKKGKAGKVTVNVKSEVLIDKINIEFEKQDKFGQGFPDWWYGGTDYSSTAARWIPNTSLSWGDRIADRSGGPDDVTVGNTRFESDSGNIYYPITGKNDNNVYNKTNRDQVFGTGFTFNNSVSVGFNSEKSNTFLSYSNWNQQGIIKGKSSYDRTTVRLNHEFELMKDMKLKFNTSYSKINSDRIQQGSNLQGLYLGYLRTSPDFDNTDYKGTYYNEINVPTQNAHRGYRRYLGDGFPTYGNPGWTINEQDNPNGVERFTVTPQFTWKIANQFNLIARYGLDYYTDHRETFFPVNSPAGLGTGAYFQSDIKEKTENLNLFIQSNHEINDDINFDWILGTNFDNNEYDSFSGGSTQFTNPQVGDLRIFGNAEAANESVGNYKQQTKKHGAYLVLTTNLFKQLSIELTGRYERPSTLEKNVFYPSASLGWQFNKLFKEDSFLNFGKLRLSYGEVGIEPVPYASSTTFSPGGIASSWGDGLNASAYGNPFTRNSELGNPNLTQETVKEYEIGTDLRMFNNKMNLGVTYYDRTTYDAILRIDLAPSTGFSSTLENAAQISNKGIEVDLGYKIFNNENFKWSINANFSQNKNIVEDLGGVESVFLAGFTGTSSRAVEGEALATLWGGKFARDENNNYVLDTNGFPTIAAENGVLGDPNPDWIGGLTSSLSYKNFTLSAQVETSQGNDHWTGTEGVLKYFGIDPITAIETTASENLQTFDGRTITAGTTFRGTVDNFGGNNVALTEEWYLANGGGFGSQAESFVQDASWTRLREITLAYNVSTEKIGKIGLTSLQLSLSGRNLALWTDIKGFDPDVNLTGASKGRGLDYFTNPATQSYIMTVKLGF
ncbi:MAG: SusC/RagA family TonB-linked outer membrane protein [Flavobacteriaceae bacterium]